MNDKVDTYLILAFISITSLFKDNTDFLIILTLFVFVLFLIEVYRETQYSKELLRRIKK